MSILLHREISHTSKFDCILINILIFFIVNYIILPYQL